MDKKTFFVKSLIGLVVTIWLIGIFMFIFRYKMPVVQASDGLTDLVKMFCVLYFFGLLFIICILLNELTPASRRKAKERKLHEEELERERQESLRKTKCPICGSGYSSIISISVPTKNPYEEETLGYTKTVWKCTACNNVLNNFYM
ncbi:MAG: hypothetical protein ABIE68_03580 [bacterium]